MSSLKDPGERARTSFRLGEVYEYRLKQSEKALTAYEQALAVEPDFRPARDGRLRLLTEARDFKRLVDELQREAETARDPKLAVAALLREGEVWRERAGRRDGAPSRASRPCCSAIRGTSTRCSRSSRCTPSAARGIC